MGRRHYVVRHAAVTPPTLPAVTGAATVALSSSSLTAGASSSTSGGTRKWNPGHYMYVRPFNQATRLSYYQKPDFKNNPNIIGAMISVRWAQLESDTRGVYDNFTVTNVSDEYPAGTYGISWLRNEYNALAAMGKRLIVRVFDMWYGDNQPNRAGIFPAYLRSPTNYIYWNGNDVTWQRWLATPMGWYIDLFNAYGAAFDGLPYFEMISPHHETSMASVGGYDESADFTQMKRLVTAMRAAFPTSNVWLPVNWSPSSHLGSMLVHLRSNLAGCGNPDTSCPAWGDYGGMTIDKITRGAASSDIAAQDFRGTMPIFGAIEGSSLGYAAAGSLATQTAQQSYDFANGQQHISHYGWERQLDSVATYAQRWYKSGTEEPGGILDVIGYPAGTYGGVAYPAKAGQPLTYTSRPPGY